MSRRILLFLIALFSLGVSFGQTTQISRDISSTPNALQFFVIGDWGRKGSSSSNTSEEVINQLALAATMDQVGAIIAPSFIISTGDNFYPSGVKSDSDPRWKQTFEDVYRGKALQVPWYISLGNHDHGGNVQSQIDYKGNEKQQWYLPSRYYSKVLTLPDGTVAKFVFIDTTPLVKGIDSTQLRWLANELSDTHADWKWVVGHHPLYSGNFRTGEQRKLRNDIESLLIRNNVDVYLCGHDHNLQYLKKGKIKYFISGAGSEIYKSKNVDGLTQFIYCKDGVDCTSAFMTFSLEKTSMMVQMIDSKGQLLFKKVMEK